MLRKPHEKFKKKLTDLQCKNEIKKMYDVIVSGFYILHPTKKEFPQLTFQPSNMTFFFDSIYRNKLTKLRGL
jgi:hypothetical protein